MYNAVMAARRDNPGFRVVEIKTKHTKPDFADIDMKTIPNLMLDEREQSPLGKYGRMRRRNLKEHRPVFYTNLLTTGKLDQHLAEVDLACEERMELLVSQMARQEGVTEALKAAAQMEWVRRMNSIRNRAEEIILQELVFLN